MSLGRSFLINELKRLELRFHPDSQRDEQAVEYIRAAIRALTPQSSGKKLERCETSLRAAAVHAPSARWIRSLQLHRWLETLQRFGAQRQERTDPVLATEIRKAS